MTVLCDCLSLAAAVVLGGGMRRDVPGLAVLAALVLFAGADGGWQWRDRLGEESPEAVARLQADASPVVLGPVTYVPDVHLAAAAVPFSRRR